MILTIYKRALTVLMKKPFTLWGISLLEVLLSGVVSVLFGAIYGLALGINLLLDTSMIMIFLHGYRGDGVACVQLFDCFKDGATAKRVLGGMAWMKLWIFLWGLIPVVGPIFTIIRTYEYRLTPYILVTEPEISATEAMKVSAQRTKGYKGKMWLADILLPVIVVAIVLILALLGQIPYIGGLFIFVMVIFLLCYLALSPLYTGLIQAAFYEEIKNPTYVAPVRIPQNYGAPRAASYCPHCGSPLPPESKFCSNCGNKLD
ncbi:MAG: zinc-ribbon domain-containing protein [Oscillospiraceae bacterium]|nr:zinc-ribbon domain-containing protein [Oscillospiraceae bacterium]